MNPLNREFVITYYRRNSDEVDTAVFRTLKHLSDWFNNNENSIVITGIEECPGNPFYDKYYGGAK